MSQISCANEISDKGFLGSINTGDMLSIITTISSIIYKAIKIEIAIFYFTHKFVNT
jgi:hypothetical protein